LGPVALIVSLVATFMRPRHRFGSVARALAVAFVVMGTLQFISAGAHERLNLAWFRFDFSVFVLVSLLPLLGCLHLTHLARREAAPL
jgi:hypothetical protein